jgi:hypothetical protein
MQMPGFTAELTLRPAFGTYRGGLTAQSLGAPAISAELVTAQINWGCVGDCLSSRWRQIPWSRRIACAAACASCLARFPPGCVGCVRCLAGYAGPCLTSCP